MTSVESIYEYTSINIVIKHYSYFVYVYLRCFDFLQVSPVLYCEYVTL